MINRLRFFGFVLFLFSAIGCSQNGNAKLNSFAEFKKLSGNPLSAQFSDIESVKFVYHIKKKKLHFINSNRYTYHYNFCQDNYGLDQGSDDFFLQNYGANQKEREFLLGNLNKIKKEDLWFFDTSSLDKMSAENVELLYKQLKDNTFIKQISFYPNSAFHIANKEKGLFEIPTISANEIFKNLEFQIINQGKSVGILKEYKVEDLENVKPNPNEIIVLDQTPYTLPDVKGILVKELQTPFSHIVLLASNRGIPIVALNPNKNSSNYSEFLNQKIELKVDEFTFNIQSTKKKIKDVTTYKPQHLTANFEVKNLIDFSEKHKDLNSLVGTKAANFYLIKQFQEKKNFDYFKVPENSFAIPFYFYKEHIQNHKIDKLIQDLETIPKDSVQKINRTLKQIRKAIKKATVNPNLIQNVEQKLSGSEFDAFRFRSSSNAEDLKSFNGAGLYDSKTGKLNDEKKPIDKAIKKVWASLWNERAYWERAYYNIVPDNLAMGILVHRSFPDEFANGVIITKNLFRDVEGISINTQLGDVPVVNPKSGDIAEFAIIKDVGFIKGKDEYIGIDYVNLSSLNENKPILTRDEMIKLYFLSYDLKRFLDRKIKGRNVYDIEYKVEKNGVIYFKQARVFK